MTAEAPFAVMPPEKPAVTEDARKPLETREKQGQACPQGLQREYGPRYVAFGPLASRA